ncbi:MAG: oligosaccharide flippase family protein [Candidatus Accumulibacter sp.]|uniref:Oligosaccharide flippase family protein n=1 Tax=Candidatus Accumulibacter proximus TaxID=2954385 RepID=A0A935PVY5_9PROT|nr:oligosaccharide flippase family protein [Candidatus Accumulibacter proximus]
MAGGRLLQRGPPDPCALILGAVGLVQGFDNIGIVNFRKEFNFVRDFQLMFTKRLVAFVVTVMLAYYLRSFWALLAGIVTSRIVGTALELYASSLPTTLGSIAVAFAAAFFALDLAREHY